jgi:hypothetical protein
MFFLFEVFMGAEITQAVRANPLPLQHFANCVRAALFLREIFRVAPTRCAVTPRQR